MAGIELAVDEQGKDRQYKENDTKDNGYPEQCLFDAAARREYRTTLHSGQATQTGTFALQDYANDQRNGDYNQSHIKNYIGHYFT
jgi:hypothetical protein